jgi:diadenosine tetraphosphate (Ap4A) HIT family hydrolase
MSCPGCERVAAALAGGHPDLIADLGPALLLLGEHQAYPGYAVLWSKQHVRELHQLSPAEHDEFTRALRRASLAVEAASGCWKLNLASLGNAVGHLHVHLFPRSAMDPDKLKHPWVHEADFGEAGTPQQRTAMIERIREALAVAEGR